MTKYIATITSLFVACSCWAGPPQCTLPAKPIGAQSQWQSFVNKCGRMETPACVWLNYRNEYAERNLTGFDHHYRKGNVFGGGICVVIAEPRRVDGQWYLYEVARIDADECSVKAIRDAWAKHQGHYREESYEPQSYQPTMNYGGVDVCRAATVHVWRRGLFYFMFGGAACST